MNMEYPDLLSILWLIRYKEAGRFLFGETAEFIPASSAREHAIQMMLSLRLEGGSSIGAISTIMNRFEYDVTVQTPSPNPTLVNDKSMGYERHV
jgi:hypothetical protein